MTDDIAITDAELEQIEARANAAIAGGWYSDTVSSMLADIPRLLELVRAERAAKDTALDAEWEAAFADFVNIVSLCLDEAGIPRQAPDYQGFKSYYGFVARVKVAIAERDAERATVAELAAKWELEDYGSSDMQVARATCAAQLRAVAALAQERKT